MMSPKVTQAERRGASLWITLNSPANRNALSPQLLAELVEHLDHATADASLSCIVLTGNGPAFCAGADLKNRGASISSDGTQDSPFVKILRHLAFGPKPVVAGVNGHAFGGGVGLAAACDVAVGVDSALFSFSEVRLGLVPATISVVVVPKIGVGQARRLFVTGERFSAEQAREYGLLHRVVSPDALQSALEEEVAAICKGGPKALGEAKDLVHQVAARSVDDAFVYTERLIGRLFAGEEAEEGAAAFAEKRPPRWVQS